MTGNLTVTAISPDGLPFRLTICGIPELDEHRTAGVTHVLSLLDPGYDDPSAFTAFGRTNGSRCAFTT
jgi:hypothetical protein